METGSGVGPRVSTGPSIRSRLLKVQLDRRYRTTRRILAEMRRRLTFRRHVISVFLQLDDPYSYLLSHYLVEVAKQYEVQLRYYLGQALRGEFMPEPAMAAEYAVADCKLLAVEFGVPFLDKGTTPAVEHRRPLLDFLAEEQEDEDFVQTFTEALSIYWRGDTEGVAKLMRRPQPERRETNVLIAQNQLLLRKLGHYNSAMMLYGGEWYWGVDRLHHLLTRLDALGANRGREPSESLASLKQAMQLNLPAAVPKKAAGLPPLEMFHTFRSPYSYLALQRAKKIADAFGLKLVIRPILPMVMRGLSVPKQKLRYIVFDANREAELLGLPFGNIADSLGSGVERCMAAFLYAKEQGKERDFAIAAGIGIFGGAIDVSSDDGMRKVTEKAGLFWPDVVAAMEKDDWKVAAEQNLEDMTESGVWGVPSFRVGNAVMWGQDRHWLLARSIEDMCRSGDGFLT